MTQICFAAQLKPIGVPNANARHRRVVTKKRFLQRINTRSFTTLHRISNWTWRSSNVAVAEPLDDFVVVNFYKFVYIRDPQEEVAKHQSFLKVLNIRGRIYLSDQGINAQYSGPSKDALAYVEWLKEDSWYADVLVQISPALSGHAFPRLKLQYKPSLVQLEGGIAHLPLLDPSMRATPLGPSEWRERLKVPYQVGEELNFGGDSRYILLDVRNGYEWDVGHFSGAQRPDVDCFRSTSFGLTCGKVCLPSVAGRQPNCPLDSIHRRKFHRTWNRWSRREFLF